MCVYQEYPLHKAIKLGEFDTVKHLVVKGTDINIKDNNGVSATDGRYSAALIWIWVYRTFSMSILSLCTMSHTQSV